MIKIIRNLTLLFTLIVCIVSCSNKVNKSKNNNQLKETISLKNSFKEDFLIGTALNTDQIKEVNTAQTALITREFNAITPENDLKWEQIHPKKDTYNFDVSDAYVAFGNKNNMQVVGHTLLWHSQLAPWVNEIKNKDTLVNQITKHINTIAGRYKGEIDAWDVVNEALNEDGSPRESIFYKLFGDESYLELAFKLAEKAAPDAELVYNDYNLWKPAKREGVIRIVQNLQAKGIRIDGVGMQAHWSLEGPSIEDIENSIIAYAALGVKVMFTELDITVLPNPWELDGAAVEESYERYENDPKMNPYPNGLTEDIKLKIAKRYEDIFNLFLKHKDKISRVTFWGVNDGQSWLNDWPIKGRTNYPLLFGRDDKPKEVYNTVINTKN